MKRASLKNNHEIRSELRRDLVSGDWIVFAPGRLSGKHSFTSLIRQARDRKALITSIKKCPFESFSEEPILMYADKHDWSLKIIPNKYPAFIHKNACAEVFPYGPYKYVEGIGYHEILVTRDHTKDFSNLSLKRAEEVIDAFAGRYHSLSKDKCLAYVSMFHNYGARAGASIYHPHYQIMATPIVPPHISHSLKGSFWYREHFNKCVHCVMIAFEKKKRERVILENSQVIAYAPFASKTPFEMRIFPKKHLPYFEETPKVIRNAVAHALQEVLRKMQKALHSPDYNFFIHTAPLRDKAKNKTYHWHIEIVPRLGILGGFELGTGLDVNPMDPNMVASLLRKTKA